MVIYLFISIITAISMYLSIKAKYSISRKINTICAISIPSLIYAIRYGIGTDYYNYASAFNTLQYTKYGGRFEWAYVSINLLVGKLDGTLEMVFLITSIIMFVFLYLILKEYSSVINPGIVMFAYMLLYYQMSFNLVRNSVAMIICLYSLKYIQNRNFLKFFIIIFLASGFHNSALLVIPLYFLNKTLGVKTKFISRFSLYTIVVLSVFILDKALIPFLESIPKLSYYTFYLKGSANEISFVPILIQIPFVFFGIIPFIEIGKENKKFSFFFSTFVISVLLKMSRFVGTQYLERISLNYEIVLILLVGYYMSYFNKRKEFFVSFILLVYVLFYWYFVYIYMGNHGTYPYQTILSLF